MFQIYTGVEPLETDMSSFQLQAEVRGRYEFKI